MTESQRRQLGFQNNLATRHRSNAGEYGTIQDNRNPASRAAYMGSRSMLHDNRQRNEGWNQGQSFHGSEARVSEPVYHVRVTSNQKSGNPLGLQSSEQRELRNNPNIKNREYNPITQSNMKQGYDGGAM